MSGNGFVDNADYREWISRTFEASAVDQETAAIAQVAYTNGVPFIAFRGLSDLAGGREGPNRARDLGGLAAGCPANPKPPNQSAAEALFHLRGGTTGHRKLSTSMMSARSSLRRSSIQRPSGETERPRPSDWNGRRVTSLTWPVAYS